MPWRTDHGHLEEKLTSETIAIQGEITAMQHDFTGKLVTITYDDEVCRHAARCVRSLPTVFDPDRTPWVDPDRGSVDAIREAVDGCPSGALGVRNNT